MLTDRPFVLPILSSGTYEKGRKVSDEELDTVRMERWDFHGEWNYTVYPARRDT